MGRGDSLPDATGKPGKLVVWTRLWRLLLLVGVPLYLVLCVAMAVSQRAFIYYPRVFSHEIVERMAQLAHMERWTNSAGQFIGMQSRSRIQPAVGTVLITYGNGNTAIGCDHYVDGVQRVAAFDVFILEYPGYEDRPGTPSQASLFSAADEAFRRLPTGKPIYLIGESLGTGVAAHLAGTFPNQISGVLLVSPFNNLASAAQNHFPFLPVRLLLRDRFASDEYLKNYRGKVGFTLDGRDVVVPEKFGRRLFDGYSGPKKLWEFPLGSHCQITEPTEQFSREVVDFWRDGAS